MSRKAILFLMLMFLPLFTTAMDSGIALAEKGRVKVSVFPTPPNLHGTLEFSEPSGNNILDAEEKGKIKIRINNKGKGDAFDVKARINMEKEIKGLFFKREISFGTIPAGRVITKDLVLTAGEEAATSTARLTVSIKEANGFDADPKRISFQVKSLAPPELVVADMGIDDQNGNRRVEPMEMVELTARVQNIGHGDARDVVVNLRLGENVFLGGDARTHFEPGTLHPGEYKDIKFIFYTNKRIANNEKVPISLDMREARPRFKFREDLDLVMNAPQKRPDEFVVKGYDKPSGDIELAKGLSIDVEVKVPKGKRAGRYDVAVVIGNGHYTEEGVPDVEFAHGDAKIMKEYLTRTFGYDPKNIIYEENAVFAKFNEIFGSESDHKGKLFDYVKKDVSQVFIYYTGHGAPDIDSGEAYFVPVDANPHYIDKNGYRLKTFYHNIAKIPAKKVIIVLDACFSGSYNEGLLFKGISPIALEVKEMHRAPANGVVFASSGMKEVSTWYPEKKHSLFTYYFFKGLQGEADGNRDRRITIGELKGYLVEHVPYMARRLKGVEQNPVIIGREDEVLARLED